MSLHFADYCFSNDYINSIISYPYIFDGGDLAPYYVSFLRFLSLHPLLCLILERIESSFTDSHIDKC